MLWLVVLFLYTNHNSLGQCKSQYVATMPPFQGELVLVDLYIWRKSLQKQRKQLLAGLSQTCLLEIMFIDNL